MSGPAGLPRGSEKTPVPANQELQSRPGGRGSTGPGLEGQVGPQETEELGAELPQGTM